MRDLSIAYETGIQPIPPPPACAPLVLCPHISDGEIIRSPASRRNPSSNSPHRKAEPGVPREPTEPADERLRDAGRGLLPHGRRERGEAHASGRPAAPGAR